ncbi:MAG: hypothetical protein JW915_14245 [Chitinispirillaceae bacterium]|nr:hypothetical protein [Chitinispirillaceae bacterium]
MKVCKLLLCSLALSAICFADEQCSEKVKLSSWGYLTFGSIRKSHEESAKGNAVKDYKFDGEALADFDAGIKAEFLLGENTKGRFHIGLTTAFMVADHSYANSAEYLRKRFVPYIIDAAVEKKYVSDSHEFFGEFGYFPVKYNSQSRNLGEYLFRSGTYYPYLVSGFELADKEKLVGLHGRFTKYFSEKSDFKADLYFTNDMRDYPIHGFSLSYIFSLNLARFLEVSAGAMHAHLIEVDRRKSTPFYDKEIFDGGDKMYDVCLPDTNTGDTTKFTFRGTKLMGRFTIDPKVIFGGGDGILGKEDLKLYFESAILGFKNYPVWYENRLERMPVMAGFNFPTFKLLDVLAIEIEHNPSPYTNTAERVWKQRSPLPYIPGKTYYNLSKDDQWPDGKPGAITNDDFKWSVYASRKFGKFRISGQIASDHHIRAPYMLGPPTSYRYTELCQRSTDWYWMTRVSYAF